MKQKESKKRVWFVSELYYPELTSTGYFLTNLAEGIADQYEVSALCCQPSYLARGLRAPWEEVHQGVHVYRCRSTTLDKDKLPFRIINLITATFSMFLSGIIRFRRDDIVISVTNPPLLPYMMLVACRVRRAKFVMRVDDVYPEVLIRLGLLESDSFLARTMQWASKWLFRGAARIVVLGRDVQELICNKLDSGRDRVIIATNWGDTDVIIPQQPEENGLLRKTGIGQRFVVQYCGNIGRTHGIQDIVEAAELLRADLSFHFLLIGWGAKKEWALQERVRRGLTNLTILDPLPWDELCDGLNACSVAIISFSSGMSGISVPSRMYNVLAAGKPILAVCDKGSELARVVEEESIGWVIPPGHPEAIVATLREASDSPGRLRAMGERARRAAEKKYTLSSALWAYRDLIEGVASR